MKKTVKYLIKEMGINDFLAVKAHYYNKSEGYCPLYWSIKNALSHKWTKEDILYDLHWSLSMIKDFAQYQ